MDAVEHLHAHIDDCFCCGSRPFELCREGGRLLEAAAKAVTCDGAVAQIIASARNEQRRVMDRRDARLGAVEDDGPLAPVDGEIRGYGYGV